MIPIFRSYELDTAFLIEGSYIKENGFYINNNIPDYNKPVIRHKICDEDGIYHEVSKDYLSIHFPNMLDSQGNKIFASLQEDGKGGDIMQDDEYIGIAKYIDCQFVVEYENCIDNIDNGNFDVIGIQE